MPAHKPVPNLPKSFVADPWQLVNFEGELRLAYMVKYYGTGFPVGSFTGARGHFVSDDGVVDLEPFTFQPCHFVYNWRNRPSAKQLEKARMREQQGSIAA